VGKDERRWKVIHMLVVHALDLLQKEVEQSAEEAREEFGCY
jgi:hypothetical protein